MPEEHDTDDHHAPEGDPQDPATAAAREAAGLDAGETNAEAEGERESEPASESGERAGDADADAQEIPQSVVDATERLTRLAREAVDDAEADAYRADRDDRLAEHDFTARVREDDSGETLVLHPDEWVADGTIRTDRIEDTTRAIELSLSGAGDPDDWDAVDAHNRELAQRVSDEHGDVHGATASVLADYASNHYAKRVEDLTASELREFRDEYVPRNAWLDDDQVAVLAESVRYAFDAAKERVPDW